MQGVCLWRCQLLDVCRFIRVFYSIPANARPLSNDFWLLSRTVTGTPAALAATRAIPRPYPPCQSMLLDDVLCNFSYHLSSTNYTQLLDLGGLRLSQPLAARAELATCWAECMPRQASCDGSGNHFGGVGGCIGMCGRPKVQDIFQCRISPAA